MPLTGYGTLSLCAIILFTIMVSTLLSLCRKRKYAPERVVLFSQVTVLAPNTPKPNSAGCSRNALRPEERVMWHRCYPGYCTPILIVLKSNMVTCSD